MVAEAKARGLELPGPNGLLKLFTKNVLETATRSSTSPDPDKPRPPPALPLRRIGTSRAGWAGFWLGSVGAVFERSQVPSVVGIRSSDRGSRQRPRRRCRSQSAASSKT